MFDLIVTGGTAVMPASTEAADIGVQNGRIAVIEIRRTAIDHTEKPFRITITSYPADRNRFTITVDDRGGASRRSETG